MFWNKKNRRKTNTKRLSVESLEDRKLMAGNVLAAYNAGSNNLVLTGDAANNQVEVRPGAAGGIVITGLGTTTINGVASVVLPTPSLNAVNVQMNAGNDLVRFVDTFMNQFNSQEMGAGNDTVQLTNVRVRNAVNISTLGGNDIVKVGGIFAGNIRIATEAGDDQVTVSGRSGVVLQNNFQVSPDYVFGGAIGGGRLIEILTGDDKDIVQLSGLQHDGRVWIDTGDQNDLVRTFNTRVADRIDLFTQAGDDTVNIQSTRTPVFAIRLGAGDDLVTIDAVSLANIGAFQVDGGFGNDTVDKGGLAGGAFVNVETIL
jgi:Planctomycete extracellular